MTPHPHPRAPLSTIIIIVFNFYNNKLLWFARVDPSEQPHENTIWRHDDEIYSSLVFVCTLYFADTPMCSSDALATLNLSMFLQQHSLIIYHILIYFNYFIIFLYIIQIYFIFISMLSMKDLTDELKIY